MREFGEEFPEEFLFCVSALKIASTTSDLNVR